MKSKYVIGVDYGTESGRALLVDVTNGREIATHVTSYKHGVVDESLPNGKKLGIDWALQHPHDYLDVLFESIPQVMRDSQVKKEDVIGIGIDFTSSTILPLDYSGLPLCFDKEWENNPHSWAKLWKHHAAQEEANVFTRIAIDRNEEFINYYGGKVSSEWLFPKILQILNESPEVYEATDLFMEACDWVTYQLTGNPIRSSNTCGYKAFYNKRKGYPSKDYLRSVNPRLENIIEKKLRGEIYSISEKAGSLKADFAEKLDLLPSIAVAVGIIDAHAGVPAVGAVNPGDMVMTMGTSTCHMVISENEKYVKGIAGLVEDGIIPGYYSYESGQAAVGDAFAWFVEKALPGYIEKEAQQANQTVHELLEEKASQLKPGQSGLVGLDWWNGNRFLNDSYLSGVMVGYSLNTQPEEVYRALLESTAYGTKRIIDGYTESGVEVKRLFASGGLPERNRLLMQIYADVTNMEIIIGDSKQTTALGASMYAAVAAGEANGGYKTIVDAAKKMAKVKAEKYVPNPEHIKPYEDLYKKYLQIHDYFGSENEQLMHDLKRNKMRINE